MTTNKRRRRWPRILLTVVLVAAVVGAGAYAVGRFTSGASAASDTTTSLATVAIQPLDVAQSAVSASGNLELIDAREVPLAVGGIVRTIAVQVGDAVKAGQTLIELDTTDLERSYAQAMLTVESAKLALSDLQTPATTAEIEEAQATLATAQQSLADLQSGSSAADIAAASSSLAAAQSAYAELTAPPTEDALTQLRADLSKKEIALQDAQRAYDQVAWRGGDSSEAVALQTATIDYESAQAAFNEANAPASDSSIQSAQASVASAQSNLESLVNSTTQAALTAAQAQVATAQANLDDLQRGPTDSALRAQQISLEQALISLEQTARDLDAATLKAPMDGVIISITPQVGLRSAADSTAVTLADPTALQLVVNVAEADIVQVQVGQAATVTVDALPGNNYTGVVDTIAPVNSSSSTAIAYPVTIRLTDDSLTGVLPGMNAVATLATQTAAAAGSWLVPTNAVHIDGSVSTVVLVRNGATSTVQVTPAGIQGEWTIVQSADLQSGDEVAGSLVSHLNSNTFGRPGGATGGVMIPGAGGPPPGN